MNKVEKQFMKMMVLQIVKLAGVQVMLHKKEMLIPFVKVRLSRTISSSSSSDDGDNGGNMQGSGTSGGSRGVGGTGGGYVSQVDLGMSWAQGDENYYATQDTDHGY